MCAGHCSDNDNNMILIGALHCTGHRRHAGSSDCDLPAGEDYIHGTDPPGAPALDHHTPGAHNVTQGAMTMSLYTQDYNGIQTAGPHCLEVEATC